MNEDRDWDAYGDAAFNSDRYAKRFRNYLIDVVGLFGRPSEVAIKAMRSMVLDWQHHESEAREFNDGDWRLDDPGIDVAEMGPDEWHEALFPCHFKGCPVLAWTEDDWIDTAEAAMEEREGFEPGEFMRDAAE